MRRTVAIATILLWPPIVCAQPALPKVTEIEWPTVRDQCSRLIEGLRKAEMPLPAEVERKLGALLMEKDHGDLLERVQNLLDPLCLVGISINPESRVKVARGSAPAELIVDRPQVMLLKVSNDAGITAAVAITGEELRTKPARDGQWLEVAVLTQPPLGKKLSGNRLEYVPIVLTAREAGKREATLKFDAGQGTQDLGFRAETPILFRVVR